MTEELKILISAEIADLKKNVQDAKKQVDTFAKQGGEGFKKFSEGAKKVGTAVKEGLKVAVTAVAAAGAALVGLAESTAEYRTAQAKLTTAFESAGASADVAKQTYNDLQRVLGDTDVAVEAANHLAKMTTNEQELAEWTNICQGVYATFGDSLPIEGLTEAANETAKVGQVTGTLADALNWAGISEDEFNEKLAACNSEAEREKLIRETLNGVYDEAAQAYEKNAAEILAANEAQETLNNGLAALGAVVAPIVTLFKQGLGEALQTLVPYFQLVSDGLMGMINGVDGAAAQLEAGVSGIMGGIVDTIASALPMVLNVAVDIIGALLTGITQALPSLLKTVGELLPKIVRMLVELIPQITGAILGAIPDLISALAETVAAILEGLGELLPQVLTQIVEIIPKVIESLMNAIPLILQAAINMLLAIVQAIPVVIVELVNALPQLIESILNTIIGALPLLIDGAIGLFMGIVKAIPQIIPPIIKALPQIINAVINALVDYYPILIGAAIDVFMAIVEAIFILIPTILEAAWGIVTGVVDVIKNLIPKIGELFVNIYNVIKEKITQAKDKVVEIFNNMKASLGNVINNIKNTVGNVFENIKNSMNEKLTAARTAITNIFDGIRNAIKSKIEAARDTVKNIIDKIKSFFNFSWSLPKLKMPSVKITGKFSLSPLEVPKFSIAWNKLGGVFDKPTVFSYADGLQGIGEDGAEAVVPLENNLTWLDKLANMLSERMEGTSAPIVLQVDGKTFAQISVDSINQLTKQRGSLALNLV